MEDALETGQIAFDLQKDLATYFYPKGKKFVSRNIFTSMKRWLKEKEDVPQGQEVKKKWNALKNEFSWASEHEPVFCKLLDTRKVYVHPKQLIYLTKNSMQEF